MPAANAASWVGVLLAQGRYQVVAPIGSGGMGHVYRARDRNLGCDVVIKVPRAPLLADDPEFAGRFAREVRTLVQLAHPHIVKISDVGEHDGLPFAVMQFLTGGSLRDRQRSATGGAQRSSRPVGLHDWLPAVAAALDYMHGQGYLHRDVKPDNILFDAHDTAHLSDFGIAKALGDGRKDRRATVLTCTGMVLGTPTYMAPELVLGEPCDGRADQYALAVTVYELLSGGPPFVGATPAAVILAQTTQPPPPLGAIVPGLPQGLVAAVERGLRRDPRERFESCGAFARAVLDSLPRGVVAAPAARARPVVPAETAARGASACPGCHKRFYLPATSQGKKVRCPSCGTVFLAELVSREGATGVRPVPAPPPVSARPAASAAPPVQPPAPAHKKLARPPASLTAATILVPAAAARPRPRRTAVWLLAAIVPVLAITAGVWWFVARTPETSKDPTPDAVADVARPAFGRPLVVLVGVNECADRTIHKRAHPEEDAKALHDLFTSRERLGAVPSRTRLLLGTPDSARNSRPATKDNILGALKWLSAEAGPDDLVVFAFFGPGAPFRAGAGRHCYFASDSTSQGRARDAVLASEVAESLLALRSQRFCALLDVDFESADDQGGAESPFDSDAWSHFLGSGDPGADARWPGRSLFVAADGLSRSPAAGNQGVFARVVLDALGGKADNDGEPDGVVTNRELANYLGKELPALASRHASDGEPPAPHAVFLGDSPAFALTENPAVAPAATGRVEKFTRLAAGETRLTSEIAEEGKAYLSRMPRLDSQRKLRKDYQALADGQLTVTDFLDRRAQVHAAARLPDEAARDFAKTVLDATRLTRENYAREVHQGDLAGWAVRGLYRAAEEQLPDSLSGRLAQLQQMPEQELSDFLADARRRLGDREDLRGHKAVDIALAWMAYRLDPHCQFYGPDDLKLADGGLSGQVTGVGVFINKDRATDYLRVISPTFGGPAHQGGVQAGDLITTITRSTDDQGQPLGSPEVTTTRGLSVADASKKILGAPGTTVKLTVRRPGVESPIEFDLVRRSVPLESVLGARRTADATWDYWIDPDSKIAYLRLTQFQRNSTHDMARAMAALQAQGLKALVLDLRFNGGGYLDVARDVTDLFIDDEVIVTYQPRGGDRVVTHGYRDGSYVHDGVSYALPSYTDFPMACLVNGTTASGSEILAACLQDHHRALVLGERTFGKGSIQTVLDFEKQNDKVTSQLKLTTSLYYRPNGKNIEKSQTPGGPADEWGVTPDLAVALAWAEREKLQTYLEDATVIRPPGNPAPRGEFKDRQLALALDYLRSQVKLADRGKGKKP
ncbi:MAG TPA: S41 family peptidase [Gemmataceae bacterium]|nr:S41 family peptidase [Gemmataceae bacterium]